MFSLSSGGSGSCLLFSSAMSSTRSRLPLPGAFLTLPHAPTLSQSAAVGFVLAVSDSVSLLRCSFPLPAAARWHLLPALRLVPVTPCRLRLRTRGLGSSRYRLPLLGTCSRCCGSCQFLSPFSWSGGFRLAPCPPLARFAAPWRLLPALRLFLAFCSLLLSLVSLSLSLSVSAFRRLCGAATRAGLWLTL